jgi:DNA-binding winged helix-turn-helix (wHTH) protein
MSGDIDMTSTGRQPAAFAPTGMPGVTYGSGGGVTPLRWMASQNQANRGALAAGRADRSPIRLGTIEVLPGARVLLVDGVEIDIGGRAFDLLMVLLEAKGEIVSKEEIMRRVWPTVTVVESNLKVQLSQLRRALGTERWRIKTVSGRGCLLVIDNPCASSRPALRLVEPADPDRPLIIVVEADPGTRERMVRAVADVARSFAGVTRLALIEGDWGTEGRLLTSATP